MDVTHNRAATLPCRYSALRRTRRASKALVSGQFRRRYHARNGSIPSLAAEYDLGNGPHRRAVVHGRTLDPAERLWFGQAVLGHQSTLGAFDELSRGQPLAQPADL